jgi:MoxR-like ATPase
LEIETGAVVELADAALSADHARLRRALGEIARRLSEAGDARAARSLRALMRKRGAPLRASGFVDSLPVDAKSRLPLLEEQSWPDTPIFLNADAHEVFKSFLIDAENIERLSAEGLAARLRLLVSGPPGTGKSLLASHISAHLGRALYVVRLDSMISSLLGDTAKNMRSVFEFAPAQDAVLFLDEMDGVAKLRDDRHEMGELKRVVNTLIQGLDALPESTIVIAATNHPHLLDPAIWRRFPYKLQLDLPNREVREELWRHFLSGDETASPSAPVLATLSEGLSGADVEAIAIAARRQAVLGGRSVDPASAALAAVRTRAGRPTLPQRYPLRPDQRRELAAACGDLGLKAHETARLLGVTRQAVYRWRKGEARDGV